MPAPAPVALPVREVIDLVSDSEDEEDLPLPGCAPAARTPDSEDGLRPISPHQREAALPNFGGTDDYFHFEDDDPDLQNILLQPAHAAGVNQPGQLDPDFGLGLFAANPVVPQQRAGPTEEERDFEFALAVEREQITTADDCLQRVLELFPDVSHEYVTELYDEFGVEGDYESLPGPARLDNIIEKLLSDSTYPRHSRAKSPHLKRKRAGSDEASDMQQWLKEDRDVVPNFLIGSMRSMLKSEFPYFPNADIARILTEKKHYFQAHMHLAYLSDTETAVRRGRPSTRFADADTIALNSGWADLTKELDAARSQVTKDRKSRAEEAAKKKAEQENLQKAIDAGETAECQACFDDRPMNRQLHCNGDTPHFTCFECAETYIKSEVGESRCRVMCTAGCGAGFDPCQLNLLSDKKLLGKLAQLEQEKAIRDARLDNLEECPFCDYKAIVPPIDEDFEFRCANPGCEKVSCRRCRSTTHIPLSCEQHAKDNKINSRHKIEEAMTAALVRNCNGCKKQFIKDYGCNKMTCPSCGHLQCYICSKTLKDYDHFEQGPGGRRVNGAANAKCPLYDNVEERHEREVKAAEEAARAEVVASNPDVTAEDLEIKVSDAVKNATAQRIRQAGPEGLGGGHAGYLGVFGGAAGAGGLGLLPQVARLDAQNRARIRMARDNVADVVRNLGGADEDVNEQLRNVRLLRVRAIREAAEARNERRQRNVAALAGGRRGLFDPAPQPAAAPAAYPPNEPMGMRALFGMDDALAPNPNPPAYGIWQPPNDDGDHLDDGFGRLRGFFGGAAAPAQAQNNFLPPQPNPPRHNNAANNNHLFNFPPVPGAFHNGLYQYQPADPAPAPAPAQGGGNIGVQQARQGFEQLELMRQNYDAQNGLDVNGNNPFWMDGGVGNGNARWSGRR